MQKFISVFLLACQVVSSADVDIWLCYHYTAGFTEDEPTLEEQLIPVQRVISFTSSSSQGDILYLEVSFQCLLNFNLANYGKFNIR